MRKENGVLTGVTEDDLELLKSNPDEFWKGVTKIGGRAFKGCSSLTSINIPKGVTEIAKGAFQDCLSLTSITIPNSITKIGEYAFTHCSNLTSITIPNSVTKIEKGAFWDCKSLTSINIPDSVTKIGKGVFCGCKSLTSINIPEGVRWIGDDAFKGCLSLEEFNVEPGNTKYKTTPDKRCLLDSDNKLIRFAPAGLTSYSIPEGVTKIDYGAFDHCASLTSINIPEGVRWIEEGAFRDCSSLEEFNVEPGNTKYKTTPDKRCLLDSDTELAAFAPAGLTSYSIPEGVRCIGKDAFRGCLSLTSITIPKGVTKIADYAFRDCSSLTSITIPEGVTKIKWAAFEGCPNLSKKSERRTREQLDSIFLMWLCRVFTGNLTLVERDAIITIIENNRVLIDSDARLKNKAHEIVVIAKSLYKTGKDEENEENE